MNRKDILAGLAGNPKVEVLVVGGGINGAAVFRDLALQGVEVLLVDRADFCSGCSAASSHMAHGGIRYLENGEFRLVREAVTERNRLIANAPHLVQPLPTVIPLFRIFSGLLNAPFKFLNLLDRPSERGALVIKVGLSFYDALTHGNPVVPRHRFEGRRASLARFPALNPDIVFTASYYDGQLLSPERLTVELLLDGEAEGSHARALNHAALVGGDSQPGGVAIRDSMTGREFAVRPRVIVNAAGPWIDKANAGLGLATDYIGGTKGSHIVLDHPELRAAVGDNEFFFENADGRIVLILPWFDKVIMGTSDLPCEDADAAICTDEEIDYFIHLTSRIFPGITVTRAEVVFTFSGVRPLPHSKARNAGQISRDHSVREDSFGSLPVLSLVGGKWTTFRAFGEQVADRVLGMIGKPRLADTEERPIGGAAGRPRDAEAEAAYLTQLAMAGDMGFERAWILYERYGTRAGLVASRIVAGRNGRGDEALATLPTWSRAELAFLVEEEKALRLDDLVLRRSTLGWLGEATEPRLRELAEVMGRVLGWTKEEAEEEAVRVATLLRERHRARL